MTQERLMKVPGAKSNAVEVDFYYLKCDRCGAIIKTLALGTNVVCTTPAYHRTSGICGGSFCLLVTKDEYDAIQEGKL